jgi:murein DD-endopeptidase MepM/ murein hydrolase activator NlpD
MLYSVKRGDTFFDLGRRFEVSPDELMRLNGISDPKKLLAGSTIRVPQRAQSGSQEQGAVKKASYLGSSGAVGGAVARRPAAQNVALGAAARYVGRLAWPVAGHRMNSRFGRRGRSFHEGMDIAAPTGTPILAAHDGVVVFSGNTIKGYGNLIIIQSEALSTVYAHNHRNRVRVGQRVRRGQHIADVGATGRTTGPHLHFETRVKDSSNKKSAIDPLLFYPNYR